MKTVSIILVGFYIIVGCSTTSKSSYDSDNSDKDSATVTPCIKLEFKRGVPWGGKNYRTAVDNNSCIESYDSDGNLIASGTVYSDCGFNGEAKYYYKTGQIKRIEQYCQSNPKRCPDTCGTWVYYYSDGRVKKQVKFD
ncbi:MAG: antitoxin component YwqK of YwqJK toxin-antitoxin module [Saprospiraceae bacterium]|jgi:antitoxin component YwqK of YwqJK toxin-antitoxin module